MRRIASALLVLAAVAGAAKLGPALDSIYNHYVARDYDAARDLLGRLELTYQRGNDNFLVRLEFGDLFLDKLDDYAAAESVYTGLLEEFPRDRRRSDVMYRLALAQELQEKYLDAARNYEIVATQYMKSTYGSDALDAIERCFRKNYQDRVAYVNGYPITRIELDDRISRNPSAYEAFERKQQLLDTMVDNRLFYEAALAAGIMLDPAFLDPFTEARDRALFEEWYRRSVTEEAEPSEKHLQGRYRKDKGTKYTTPEKVHAYQILVDTKEMADSLRRELLTDTTLVWDDVAKEHSIAPDKDRGGDMGLFARGVHPKPIEATAFKLKPGQISKPVKTEDGYVLLKITDRKPKHVRPYEEARNQILSQVRQENVNRLYEEKTEELRRKTSIEIDSTAIEENRTPLAVINGIAIDRPALEARINTIPPMYRGQFQSPEGMQRILEQMILEKLILFECERQQVWLWNRVVDQFITRRDRMLLDTYKRKMVFEQVSIDSAEIHADYKATITEFKVPAQVRAREIVARTKPRARQLRRWAVAGRIPAMVGGRALLVRDADRAAELKDVLATTTDTDSLIRLFSMADPPALLRNTPVMPIGSRKVPDLGRPCPLAGPYHSDDLGFAFVDVSKEDKLYRPDCRQADTEEELVELLGPPVVTDSAATPVLDSAALGTYVGMEKALSSDFVDGLFGLDTNDVSEPVELPDGVLLAKVTKKDTAREMSFADLAKKFSTAGSKWSGGDMHWLKKGDESRDKKVVNAAFALSENRISRIITLDDSSYTFIRVEEKKKAYTRPLSEVRGKLENKLRRAKEEETYAALVQGLRAEADIDIVMEESDFIFETEELLPEEGTEIEAEPSPDEETTPLEE